MVFLENLIDEGVASNEEKLVAAADAVVDAGGLSMMCCGCHGYHGIGHWID